jgi:hypothetical protein
MTILGKDKIRLILRVLQYTPVAITFFFTLSFWREGDIEGAVAIGAVCIGLMLLNLLLHISHIRNRIMAISRPLGLVVSVAIILLGVYSLVVGSIYAGIFYVLLGMTFLFMEILKGKWGVICGAVALVLAVGILILGEVNDSKPHAIETEVGVHQEITGKSYFHA